MTNNFGQNFNKTVILNELSGANAELGEAFASVVDEMVYQTGITNPKAEPYNVMPTSWINLASKENKTPDDVQELDKRIKEEINNLAISYLFYMAKETKNLTGKLEYQQYEAYMMKHRFGRYNITHNMEYLSKIKKQIRTAFDKISGHGEKENDALIDKYDMASFIYALCTKSSHDDNGNFTGFIIDGKFTAEEYAVNENNLFEEGDNLFSIKLRTAYKVLYNKW